VPNACHYYVQAAKAGKAFTGYHMGTLLNNHVTANFQSTN